MHRKLYLVLTIVIWVSFSAVSGLIYYVNHYLPHGPSYPTGGYVCANDDQGPCGPEYVEDMRNLNIPNWAKFLKKSEGELLWIGLLIAGLLLTIYKDKFPINKTESMFKKICDKLNFSDYRRFRWSSWIFFLSLLSFLLFYYYKETFFYDKATMDFGNIYRFLWTLPFSFIGFSFLAFMISKDFPPGKAEEDKPWRSYVFHYFPKLIALSLIIFSVLHLFEKTSGYIYYFLSAGLCLYFGYKIEEFRIEKLRF